MQFIQAPPKRQSRLSQLGIQDVTKAKAVSAKKVCLEDPKESELLEQPQVVDLSTDEECSDSEDSEDAESSFREHCKECFSRFGSSTTQGFFDLEKKKFLKKEKPSAKKQKK